MKTTSHIRDNAWNQSRDKVHWKVSDYMFDIMSGQIRDTVWNQICEQVWRELQ